MSFHTGCRIYPLVSLEILRNGECGRKSGSGAVTRRIFDLKKTAEINKRTKKKKTQNKFKRYRKNKLPLTMTIKVVNKLT